LPFFDMALALKEPGLGVLDLRHGVQKLPAGSRPDVLDQRPVIEGSLSVESKPAGDLFQEIDHLLGIDVEGVQMLIDREPQRWRSGSGMTDRVTPRALTLLRDLTVFEEALEEFVCVRCGPAGIFR